MERDTHKKRYLLGIVLDATLSFTAVYPQIYYLLERVLMNLKKAGESATDYQLKYGITLLRDRAERAVFADGSYFTGDEAQVLDYLASIEFRGGSRDGKEDITGGILEQLSAMNHFPGAGEPAKVRQGLLVLSDALQKEEKNLPDLTGDEPGVYGDFRNHGLRFGYIYTYNDSYMPQLRIVDYKGELVEDEERNTCMFGSLALLLKDEEQEMVACADRLADEMLERFSC